MGWPGANGARILPRFISPGTRSCRLARDFTPAGFGPSMQRNIAPGGFRMMLCKRIMVAGVTLAALVLGAATAAAQYTKKTIKIGAVYDYSGPLAAGGSELHAL